MSEAVANLPPLREIIAAHNLNARKQLGQNFLLDLNLAAKIVRHAGNLRQGTVIEVGPGPGGLTRTLLLAGATRVIVIEKDDRCLAALVEIQKTVAGRLDIIHADALDLDLSRMGDSPRRIVANLPYNIATPLLIRWMREATAFESLTLMFQREVADRITAQPGSKAYGRLSVLCNWRCQTRMAFTLPARAFTPPPRVSSAVVTLQPYSEPDPICTMADLETVTAAAFGQRRKMLRQSLRSLGVNVKTLLDRTQISPTARAETLSVTDFTRLAGIYREMQRENKTIPSRPATD